MYVHIDIDEMDGLVGLRVQGNGCCGVQDKGGIRPSYGCGL